MLFQNLLQKNSFRNTTRESNGLDPDQFFFVLFFVALRPMSTAMVIVGRSVHLTTLFPGQACSNLCTYFRL